MKRNNTIRSVLVAAGVAALTLAFALQPAVATKSKGEKQPSDLALIAKIEAKFAADPEVSPFEIDVDSEDGVVRLSGAVETEKERTEAEQLARNVEGVKGVKNEIVLGDLSAGEVVSDAWIVSKIKAKLTADPEVRASQIDVDAVQGVVTLSGKVPSTAVRNEASSLARDTKGVRKVENKLVVEKKES